MIRSRVFVVLAITLFLAGCLCAEAADAADKNAAEGKVRALKKLTAEVLDKALKQSRDAVSTKETAEEQKDKAEREELNVRTAAAAITAAKRKTEVEVVLQRAKSELAKCLPLYQEAKNKAEVASNSLKELVTRARELDKKAKEEIPAVSSQSDNYAQVIASVTAVTTPTEALSREIDALTVLNEADSALGKLKESARKIQVSKYQAESLLTVSNIEAKMSEAKTDIQTIQQKRGQINTIVEEMNTKCQSAPDSLKGFLSSLCNNAGGFLRTATNKVKEVNTCNEGVVQRKTQLDGALAALMTRTGDQANAGKDAETVKWHANYINGEIEKIKEALRATETSVSSAKAVQNQMQNAMVKTSDQPIDANLDKTEQNKSTQLTHEGKQNPKDGNSELLNNDKLRKITKDITNNPLIGGEIPTRSAANDSAVTVFIPLLVILVISAVLH